MLTSPRTFFELVCQALPKDIRPSELTTIGKPEWWQDKPRLAAAYALRKCPRINWEAYLLNYPDVKQARIDPVLHFLKHGIYENRKLKSWHPLHHASTHRQRQNPKVSIIVYSRDNGIFLPKCLNSLANQTFKDIEIIIVDDASADESLQILRRFESTEPRAQVIALEEYQGLHMARKRAVNAATADYVMFANACDFLVPTACKTAWETIAKGYDMACFNVFPVNLAHLTQSELRAVARPFNATPAGEYPGEHLLRMAFAEKTLHYSLLNKIVERDLLKTAFAQTEAGDFPLAEDIYEFLPLAFLARNIVKISVELYTCTATNAPEDCDNREAMLRSDAGKVLPAIGRYCDKHNLEAIFKKIKNIISDMALNVLPEISPEIVTPFYNNLRKYFGDLATVQNITLKYNYKWDKISTLFKYYQYHNTSVEQIKKIGIFHSRLTTGGIESTIQNLSSQLKDKDYEIVLFVEEKSENDIKIDPDIRIYYLTPSYRNSQLTRLHLSELQQAILDSGVQIMFMMIVNRPALLWQIMLYRFMGIPVISSMRTNHNWDFLERGRKYQLRSLFNTARCLDKLFCLSTSTEIYLRAHGIDAEYIPNPIRRFDIPIPTEPRPNNILVLSRLSGHPKLIGDCLLVLKEVLDNIPDAKMIFVGDFDLPEHEKLFYEKAKKHNLMDNIEVTGWVANPAPYIDQCKLLFSASALEGFPNGISEAQARGLPVVMYDIDIMLAKGNESIIAVPQQDINGAARIIARLLLDEAELRRLSATAQRSASVFTAERFANEIIDLLQNYDKKSSLKYYTANDYQTALRYMAFYAGKKLGDLTFEASLSKI